MKNINIPVMNQAQSLCAEIPQCCLKIMATSFCDVAISDENKIVFIFSDKSKITYMKANKAFIVSLK